VIGPVRPDWSGEGLPGGEGVRFHEVKGRSFLVARIHMDAGAALSTHVHQEEQIFYVLDGAIRYQVGDETHHVHAGELLVIGSGEAHGGNADPVAGAVLLEVKERGGARA
jgi:quercetin dioxygenase-like cupin family protein